MAALGKSDAEAGPEGTTTEGADENLNAALGTIGECRRRSQDTGGATYSQEDWCFSCHSQAAFPALPAEYQVLPAVSLEILECSCQRPLSILGDSFGLLGITEAPFQAPAPLQLQIQSQALLWDDPRIFRSAELHRPALVSTFTTDMALPRDTGFREPRCEILSFDRAPETRGSGGHATDRIPPPESCLVQSCLNYGVPSLPCRLRCVIPCSPPPRVWPITDSAPHSEHSKAYHMGVRHRCECGRTFAYRRDLRRHRRIAHGGASVGGEPAAPN